MTEDELREAIVAWLQDRRRVRRFVGRRSNDKECGEVVHNLDPDGPIADHNLRIVERIDNPNFEGERAATDRATELADDWTADRIIELVRRYVARAT